MKRRDFLTKSAQYLGVGSLVATGLIKAEEDKREMVVNKDHTKSPKPVDTGEPKWSTSTTTYTTGDVVRHDDLWLVCDKDTD